jgi:uncharacterized coiled-coil protein SlyX
MFEFLNKREGAEATPIAVSEAPNPARAEQAARLQAIDGNEQAAAEFVLQCDYSELRLVAAGMIHSPELLERVHVGIRNADRRVAKLVHGRLEAIRHHQSEMAKAQACIDHAHLLLADNKLSPNQVADLDRRWLVIAAPELSGRFDEVRAALGQRLEAQVALQRRIIDNLNALRQAASAGLSHDQLAARVAELESIHDQALAAPESLTLPRHFTTDFAQERDRILAGKSADTAAPAPEVPLPEAVSAPAPVEKKQRPPKPAAAPPDPAFVAMVDEFETAISQGNLHGAAELDKRMKDTKGVRLTPDLADRLSKARAELKRLNDWARWSGNVSREELIKSAEQLKEEKLPMSELAKKVGSLRERWKKLDSSGGAAPRSLWERFDASCTAAYAPAAAHFKHLADERHANAAKGQALVDEAKAESAKLATGSPDWKHTAGLLQKLTQAWHHLGPIDRKEKKRLDSDFAQAIAPMQGPLAERRTQEIGRREELISKVAALNPAERHTVDTLRGLQEKWQEAARALPLERKDEQALWLRFRAACDAVFAKRKEGAHAADAERREHLHAKEALCLKLEQAGDVALPKLLKEVAQAWHGIGPVPRAAEPKLDKRYQAAVNAVQQRIDQTRRQAARDQAVHLRNKLRLVQEVEAALAAGRPDAGAQARWDQLPPLPAAYEHVLQQRFAAAVAGDASYAARLESQREQLLHDVLKLEIAAGIDSGAEFARDRLKLQVEVLQSSFKSGQRAVPLQQQYLQLLGLAALSDARTATRIEQLYSRVAKE